MEQIFGDIRPLLSPDNKMYLHQIFASVIQPDDTDNLFCTSIFRYKTNSIVNLDRLRTDTEYHRKIPPVYANLIQLFSRDMYYLIVVEYLIKETPNQLNKE